MNTSNLKNGLILGLIAALCVALLFNTCQRKNHSSTSETPLQDTIFFGQWRKEKKDKQDLIHTYEKKIVLLEQEKAKLSKAVWQNKQELQQSRDVSHQWQERLHKAVEQLITKDSLTSDTITPLLFHSEIAKSLSDSACDSLVQSLEQTIVNRDSIISSHSILEVQFKELQQQQEIETQALSQQLNKTLQQEKKKNRQVKWLSRGLILVSGIAASLFIIQKVK